MSVQGGMNERVSVCAKGDHVCVKGTTCNEEQVCVKAEHISARVCAQGSMCEHAAGWVCKGCVYMGCLHIRRRVRGAYALEKHAGVCTHVQGGGAHAMGVQMSVGSREDPGDVGS